GARAGGNSGRTRENSAFTVARHGRVRLPFAGGNCPDDSHSSDILGHSPHSRACDSNGNLSLRSGGILFPPGAITARMAYAAGNHRAIEKGSRMLGKQSVL